MADAAQWHEKLRYLSETVAIVDDFRNWGFTIYRTAYGLQPTSDGSNSSKRSTQRHTLRL
jgi:hypothetical protein